MTTRFEIALLKADHTARGISFNNERYAEHGSDEANAKRLKDIQEIEFLLKNGYKYRVIKIDNNICEEETNKSEIAEVF